ncbi:MAG TPA: serine/threonine-protein kinase [Pseudomonadota bacterium]|nr:serine/threonine-protein kinase [Pseudomonadota bacterium]
MIGQMIHRYKVESQLGEGGMGAVYEATDETGKRVAIKVLHKEHASNQQIALRFINEARAICVVNHPGIVEVYETGQHTDGTAYIVMELLKGETLSARMKKSPGGKMPVLECVRLGRQIASALAAAHAKTIVHRDLKPDNIMIVPDANVPGVERTKLLDFGIAKVKQEYQANDQLQTRAGVMMGTPLYMSPEQCKNAGDVDDKADVYSLGVMLYRMLSGKPPFQAAGTGELMAMHIYMQPTPLKEHDPAIPEPLRDLVHRMLAKQRQDRPSMAQVEQELEKVNVRMSGMLPAIRVPAQPPQPAGPAAPSSSEAKTVMSEGGAFQLPPSGTQDQKTVMPVTPATPAAQTSVLGNRSLRIALFAMATLLLLGLLAVLYSRLNMPDPASKPPKAPDKPVVPSGTPPQGNPVPAPAPKKIRWNVETNPPGAQVFEAGKDEPLCAQKTTPCTVDRVAQNEDVTLEFRLDGFESKRVTVSGDADKIPSVTLTKKPSGKSSKGKKDGKTSKTDGKSKRRGKK